ncbi:MAG TPA: hypothetical protein PK263_02640 [bacterium]|nr:hypothetical protein [bacterium]
MRKLTLFILGILITLSVTAVFCLASFYFAFFQPEKIKVLLQNSNTYGVVANSLRTSVVISSGANVEEGGVLEILNEGITPQAVRTISESAVDQFFSVVKSKSTDKEITIDYTPIIQGIQDSLPGSSISNKTTINLEENKVMRFLSFLNYIVLLSIFVVILLSVLFVVIAKETSRKLVGIGVSVLFAGLLTGVIAFLVVRLPGLLDQSWFGGAADAKVVLVTENLIGLASKALQPYIIASSIAAILLSLLLIGTGKAFHRGKIDKFSEKI